MTLPSTEDSFADLERNLRYRQRPVTAYASALQLTEQFARGHPEQDVQFAIDANRGWLDECIAEVDRIKNILLQKWREASLAFVMGLSIQSGQQSVVHQLPVDVVNMILSEQNFY